jgi:Bacterial HORMA domain family 1
MTASLTRTSTFTITDARYVSSKLAADLANLNARYGRPSGQDIADYAEETAQLLKPGYLKYVDFGFKSGDEWKLRLRYTAAAGGQLRDEAPGRLPTAADVAGLQFYSYLIYSDAFLNLPEAVRAAFKRSLPIQRTGAEEPTAFGGTHSAARQYSRNGVGLDRGIYRAL